MSERFWSYGPPETVKRYYDGECPTLLTDKTEYYKSLSRSNAYNIGDTVVWAVVFETVADLMPQRYR